MLHNPGKEFLPLAANVLFEVDWLRKIFIFVFIFFLYCLTIYQNRTSIEFDSSESKLVKTNKFSETDHQSFEPMLVHGSVLDL